MRIRGPILSLALLALPGVAAAQSNPECTPYSASAQAENLCNASVDATRYFHPLMGLAISGGNPVVGSFRTLGGLGHISIGLRATAFEATVPDLSYDGSTATVPEGETIPLGAPTVDVGIGLFNGLSSGLLSVDLLGSIVAVPNNIDDLQVDPDASTLGDFAYKVGYGARIGILRGGFPVPSIAVSYMKREIPQVQFGDVGGGDEYSYRIGVESTSLRATAGWRLALFEFGVGLGRDSYSGDAQVQFQHPITAATETINISLDESRTTLFADVGLNMGPLKLAGEVGLQTANDLNTASDFEGIDVNEGLKYASVGLRLSF
jgi:hypothetical protein